MIKKSKLLILVAILLLVASLSACNLLNNNEPVVTSVVFSNADGGVSSSLTIFSDLNFEFERNDKNGINNEHFLYKGTYINGEGKYDLTFLSGENKSSTFDIVYEDTTATQNQIAELNKEITSVKLISNSACLIFGQILFVNGDKSSKDKVLGAYGPSQLMPFGINKDEYDGCDYICTINKSIQQGNVLLVHGDGYVENIAITNTMLTGFNASTLGKQDVTITYAEGKTLQVKINVLPIKTKINSITMPNYLELNATLENIRAMPNYKIGIQTGDEYNSIALSNPEIAITGFDTTKEGEISIDVSYLGSVYTKKLTVFNPTSLKDLELQITAPIGVSKGEPLAFTAKVNRNNGSNATLDNEDITVSAFDSDTIGAKLVTFTYGSFTINKVFYVYDNSVKNTVISTTVRSHPNASSSIMLINGVLDLSTHYLELTHVDGTKEEVAITEDMICDYDMERLNKSSYMSLSISYTKSNLTYYANATFSK